MHCGVHWNITFVWFWIYTNQPAANNPLANITLFNALPHNHTLWYIYLMNVQLIVKHFDLKISRLGTYGYDPPANIAVFNKADAHRPFVYILTITADSKRIHFSGKWFIPINIPTNILHLLTIPPNIKQHYHFWTHLQIPRLWLFQVKQPHLPIVFIFTVQLQDKDLCCWSDLISGALVEQQLFGARSHIWRSKHLKLCSPV